MRAREINQVFKSRHNRFVEKGGSYEVHSDKIASEPAAWNMIPIERDSFTKVLFRLDGLVRLVCSVYLVCLVYLVYLVSSVFIDFSLQSFDG